jgi:hypothetical protein
MNEPGEAARLVAFSGDVGAMFPGAHHAPTVILSLPKADTTSIAPGDD